MSTKATQPSRVPTRKVTGGAMAGAAVIVLVWAASLLGVEVPPHVASAAAVLVYSGVAYLVKDRAS